MVRRGAVEANQGVVPDLVVLDLVARVGVVRLIREFASDISWVPVTFTPSGSGPPASPPTRRTSTTSYGTGT